MANQISTIERHPNRNAIISKMMAGIPLRRIAADYKVSEQALSRFKRGTLQKIILAGKSTVSHSVAPEVIEQTAQVRSIAQMLTPAVSTAAMLERKWAGIDRMKQLAESKEDIGGWASLDRAETAALQLRAQLAGELAPQASSNIQVAILIPPPPASGADGGQVLNVDARQVPLERGDSGRSNGDNSEE